jgi:hypothetical protein
MLHKISMPSAGSCLQHYTSGELMTRISETVNPLAPELNNHSDGRKWSLKGACIRADMFV